MRITCPGCHAELTLDVLLTNEAARLAVAKLAQVSVPFGALTLRYIALFRPEKRGLSIERMVRLINELVPDIERKAITRKGRDWDAGLETWRAAFEIVLAKRDKGTLTLPLTSHGLLYEVMAGLVDRIEAQAERDTERQRREHRPAGADTGPRDLSEIGEVIHSGAMPFDAKPQPPRPDYSKPSRAALELRAQMEAAKARRNAPETAPEAENERGAP